MRLAPCLLLPLLASVAVPAAAQTVVTLGSGFTTPSGVAVDGSGNVFVADQNANTVKEILAGDAFVGIDPRGSGYDLPEGVAVDSSGDIFVANAGNNEIREFTAASGFTTAKVLGSGFSFPSAVAVDSSGNVLVADTGNKAIKEITAASGFMTINTVASGFISPVGVGVDSKGDVFVADQGAGDVDEIAAGSTTILPIGSGFTGPSGVAVDGNGNVFVADQQGNAVFEIVAAGGFTTVNQLGSGFNAPEGVAVDAKGNVFVADTGSTRVREIPAGALPLLSSVLPGSRSVELGDPLSIFATVINNSSSALQNCQIALSGNPPAALNLTFQKTNPATNALVGTANTPVTISANGSQSFVIDIAETQAVTVAAMPLDFSCNDAPPAASIVGVNTVDVTFSDTPIADIVALAATASNNGIALVPVGGTSAFAIATTNLGVTDVITASVDTGGVSLPVTATICQTNPTTGQCLATPASTVTLNFGGGLTPTFSVFLDATSAIPLAPDASRVFVRFEDAAGGLHGSTSVAIQTD
jgi:sugar lactone lactonase YvrE